MSRTQIQNTVFVLLVLFCAPALVMAANRSIYIGITNTQLLGGSAITDCTGVKVNTTSCINGVAAVAWRARTYQTLYGVTPIVMPYVDRQTAFVQMYPSTWSVNAPMLKQVGLEKYALAPPSLFTSDPRTGWDAFHNSTFQVTLANIEVLPSDPWFSTYLPYFVVDGTGIIVLDSNSAPNTIDPFSTADNILKSFALHKNINVSVVIYSDAQVAPMTVYNSLGSLKPDVLVPMVLATASQVPYTVGTTLVVPLVISATTLNFVNITVDALTGLALNATSKIETLTVPINGGDAKYYADQIIMQQFAAGAGVNDPILGTSGFMPVHRNDTISMRLCLGGECPGGRMFVNAMRFTRNTDIALTSSGGFRGVGWPAGQFKISNVWAMVPFANPVCYGSIRGVTLYSILNYSIALTSAPSATVGPTNDRLLQVAGIKIRFNNALTGTRILSITVLDRSTGIYEPLDPTRLYTYAADSYVTTQFTPYPSWFAGRYAGEVAPTCLTSSIMQTAVTDYMANISYFNTTNEGTMIIDTTVGASEVLNLVKTQTDCAPGTRWDASLGSCIECPAGMESGKGALTCNPAVKSNLTTIIAIVVPVGVVVLLLIGIYIYYTEREKRKNVRNIEDAPKGGEVTLLFTDIQDSTKLWGTCPSSMSLSLDHHHRIIRECINKHRGYEVKTVGDCFMIAITSVDAGISLALDIQFRLQEQKFPKAIAATYACKTDDELDMVDDNPDDLAELDPLFNGLRVRIGMHCGTPDCVFDEVTKGYDYYGPPVNVAARVESTARGGQINASRDLINRMSPREDAEVVFYNAVELKGVAGLTEILHIVPKQLSGRVAIYTALAKEENSDTDMSSAKSGESQSMISGVNNQQDGELIKRFVACIMAAIKVMKPKDQREMVRSMCKAWRVKPPSKEQPLEDEIRLFAGRASKALKRQENPLGAGMELSVRRPSMLGGTVGGDGRKTSAYNFPLTPKHLPQTPNPEAVGLPQQPDNQLPNLSLTTPPI